jgi:hypothetical protein
LAEPRPNPGLHTGDGILIMELSIEEAREDVRATRRQIAETADELSARVDEAKQKVNPMEYVRQYPWAALAIATGVGLGISLTRADRKAAKASVRGARAAGAGIASGAVELKDRAVDLVHSRESGPSDESAAANDDAAAHPSVGSRIRDRIQSSVHDLLAHGLDELMSEIRR